MPLEALHAERTVVCHDPLDHLSGLEAHGLCQDHREVDAGWSVRLGGRRLHQDGFKRGNVKQDYD